MFGDNYQPDPYSQDPADALVGRIMSAEANLAVQQGNPVQAGAIWGQMFGNWLNRKFGG